MGHCKSLSVRLRTAEAAEELEANQRRRQRGFEGRKFDERWNS